MLGHCLLAKKFASGARHGRASNMFIEDAVIYSYGYHFPVALRIDDECFVLNKDKYSRSTSCQQSRVRSALSGKNLQFVDTQVLHDLINQYKHIGD